MSRFQGPIGRPITAYAVLLSFVSMTANFSLLPNAWAQGATGGGGLFGGSGEAPRGSEPHSSSGPTADTATGIPGPTTNTGESTGAVPDEVPPSPSPKSLKTDQTKIEEDDTPPDAPEYGIPKRPTSPPSLVKKIPTENIRCQRFFMYRGKVLDCDSNLYQDGERLRPIFKNTPAALTELDEYQARRRRVQLLAYTGTAGLALMLAGIFIGRTEGGIEGVKIRNTLILPGAVILGGSFIYGVTLLRTNESRLANAVNTYNKANPDDPVELQFSTGISF